MILLFHMTALNCVCRLLVIQLQMTSTMWCRCFESMECGACCWMLECWDWNNDRSGLEFGITHDSRVLCKIRICGFALYSNFTTIHFTTFSFKPSVYWTHFTTQFSITRSVLIFSKISISFSSLCNCVFTFFYFSQLTSLHYSYSFSNHIIEQYHRKKRSNVSVARKIDCRL